MRKKRRMKRFMRWLLFGGRIRTWIGHMYHGLHSGVPLCCALFYANYQYRDPDALTGMETDFRRGRGVLHGFALPPHYVECDRCSDKTWSGYSSHHRSLCKCEERQSLSCRFWAWLMGCKPFQATPLLEQGVSIPEEEVNKRRSIAISYNCLFPDEAILDRFDESLRTIDIIPAPKKERVSLDSFAH